MGAGPRCLELPPTPSLPTPGRSGLAPVDDIHMGYAEFGHGPAVVMLHGGLANSNYWGNQVPVLARHHTVVVCDSRGHGRSTRSAKPYTYELMASDVVGLLRGIHVPMRIVDGDHDEAIKRQQTEEMAALIPGAGLLIQPNVSHFSMLQDPDQFTADIVRFLDEP
ncbi:MAG TPA: alpha/beta hydrolase [Candidatus Xenobia bacterium]